MIILAFLALIGFQDLLPPKIELALEDRIVGERLTSHYKTNRFNEPSALILKTDLNVNSYVTIKANIDELRAELSEKLKQGYITFDHVKAEFTTLLVDQIIPHWYGTPWSYEGPTAVPNQGNIACGYFISTTLRDVGLKLNRYALAQKSPMDEAKTISCGVDIISVVQDRPEQAFEEIDRLTQEGIYFIGFDEGHVGYLLKREGQLLLIHSNYFWPGLVCMEKFEDSKAFNSFSKFHLVDISNNDALIQRWLDNESIIS